jgi:hypothetical protein
VAGRSAIADLARLAGSVPPGDTPDIAPGPAAGCADGGGFGVWLPLWSCIPAACPMFDAGNVHTTWGRIPSQPPTTRHESPARSRRNGYVKCSVKDAAYLASCSSS